MAGMAAVAQQMCTRICTEYDLMRAAMLVQTCSRMTRSCCTLRPTCDLLSRQSPVLLQKPELTQMLLRFIDKSSVDTDADLLHSVVSILGQSAKHSVQALNDNDIFRRLLRLCRIETLSVADIVNLASKYKALCAEQLRDIVQCFGFLFTFDAEDILRNVCTLCTPINLDHEYLLTGRPSTRGTRS